MGRPAISEMVRIRKAIIALPEGDFEDLVRDIQIIREIREDVAKKLEVKPNEPGKPETNPAS